MTELQAAAAALMWVLQPLSVLAPLLTHLIYFNIFEKNI